MAFVDVIAKKRDGYALDRDDIDRFVAGATTGEIPDYQAAALLMAIVLRGMTAEETFSLTDAMLRSGERVDLTDVPSAKVGKHSTGGVGDKTSLVVAPLAAACGVVVPKMSGRGLGHTGGTLDKLESIPGYRTDLTIGEFKRVLRRVGCSIIGATGSVATADKRLYALRDVTATVGSIPLIAASVMSKKLAEGTDALVLDVKCGHGALMTSEVDARELAGMLVAIGRRAGLRTVAMVTNMDAPLGHAVGNSLEVIECLETLKQRGPDDLTALVTALAGRMLVLSGLFDEEAAAAAVGRALASGAALEKMRAMIAAHGGDARIVDDYKRLPGAACVRVVGAREDGFVESMRADLLGRAAMALGAGRQRLEDTIDFGAGVRVARRPGDPVRAGEPVVELHYNSDARLGEAETLAHQAVQLTSSPRALSPLVLGTVA